LERSAGDPQTLECAEATLKASRRGAELTRQLLSFARQQSLDARVVDLGEQIEIATELALDLCPAIANVTQFESALVNLSINARDAMPNGGRLTIETRNAQLDADYAARNSEVAPGDYVEVAVSDTETGIPPAVLARVFEPFFTKGSGLGLSMVHGFAKQSHGHIKIYSEVGHGTTVRLYLPRAPQGAAPSEIPAPPDEPPRARPGEHILLVEDNEDVRRVVAAHLSALGYGVTETSTAAAALRVLRQGKRWDLLFSDVVIPGGQTGVALARAAARLRPDLRVLLTSGFARCSLHGNSGGDVLANLLSKPYRKLDLAIKLRSILDAGVPARG
jgi:CheY-like chemotaxis protein